MPTLVTGARPPSNPATTLAATRLTPDVGGRGRALVGRVWSVHRAAIYVDRPDPDGLLVVAIDDVGGVPGGILAAAVDDLQKIGIRPGMAVVPTSDGFSIPAANVAIDLTRAASWSPTLPATARFEPASELAPIVAAARQMAAGLAPVGGLAPLLSGRDGTDDPWLARSRTLVRAQLEALRTGDIETAVDPTIDLIGLGVGLTPSGDDYLVGLLAGLAATGDPARHALAAAIAARAPVRTTAIGAAMLRHAAGGAFSERLHDVLIALAGDRFDAVEAAIGRATAYGATSGSDTLVGVFAGLDLAAARWTRMPGVAA